MRCSSCHVFALICIHRVSGHAALFAKKELQTKAFGFHVKWSDLGIAVSQRMGERRGQSGDWVVPSHSDQRLCLYDGLYTIFSSLPEFMNFQLGKMGRPVKQQTRRGFTFFGPSTQRRSSSRSPYGSVQQWETPENSFSRKACLIPLSWWFPAIALGFQQFKAHVFFFFFLSWL